MLVGVFDVREMPRMTMSAWFDVGWQLAVVMRHREVQRINAAEIIGIEHVLACHGRRLALTQISLEHLHYWIEDGQSRNLEFLAALFNQRGEIGIDHRVEHDARSLLDLLEHALHLLLRPDQGMDMLDRPYQRVLYRCRLGDRGQGFTGCIGNEMQVVVAW